MFAVIRQSTPTPVSKRTDAELANFLHEAIPGLIAVCRFGSSVSGETHAESDIDLAFRAAAPLDPVDRF